MIIIRFFLHNNQVSLNFPPYKCHEKKRFSSKNMKISHKKQILNVLPILNDSDEAWAWSWIYSAFIFSILEVWRAVILLLKTILWGLLFGNLVPCVAVYRKTPRLYRNCYVIILKWRNSREHCMYNEIWWNNKTEKVWHLLVCVFMSLLLLIMFFVIVSICRRRADPNGVPHLLRTLPLITNTSLHLSNAIFVGFNT